MALGRVIKLFVGNFQKGNKVGELDAYDLSALDIEFDVNRSIEWYENEATIKVYNPSSETLAMLMNEGNSVLLQAGYEDEQVGNIFVGQIALVQPVRNGTDIAVTITCVTSRGAFYQLARLNCAMSFKKGTPLKTCLQNLCDYGQIVLRSGNSELLSQPIRWGFTFSGTFTEVVRYFSENHLFPMTAMSLYLDNNEMIVFGNGNKIELEEIALDYDNGLLQCHEIRDESLNKVNFADDPAYYSLSGSDQECPEPKKRPSKQIDRVKEIEFVSLMNPAIVPNSFVEIDSYEGSTLDKYVGVRGRFVVTDCHYSGSNFGSDFTVTCKAQESPVITEQQKERKSLVSFNRGARR